MNDKRNERHEEKKHADEKKPGAPTPNAGEDPMATPPNDPSVNPAPPETPPEKK